MAKRIVNKAERNAERYDAKEMGYQLYEDSLNGRVFDRLMPMIISEQNIILAYRNICKNNGSKTPGTDGKTIVEIQELPIEMVIKTIRNKLNYYQPKKVRRVEIPKDNGKTRPLGIPSIWDRLIQQCVLQVLEPICEAKFHERNNGFRPYRSTQNAIAQCYKMAQLQNLHFVVDVDITGFFDNIDHSKLIRQLWGLGIQDRKLIMIIKQMLKADILFNDIVITPETGTPQGGLCRARHKFPCRMQETGEAFMDQFHGRYGNPDRFSDNERSRGIPEYLHGCGMQGTGRLADRNERN